MKTRRQERKTGKEGQGNYEENERGQVIKANRGEGEKQRRDAKRCSARRCITNIEIDSVTIHRPRFVIKN